MTTYHGVTVKIYFNKLSAEGQTDKVYIGTLSGSGSDEDFLTPFFPITDSAGETTDDETDVNVYTDEGSEGSWVEYQDDGSDFVITGATGTVTIKAAENQAGNAGERISIDYYYTAEVGMGQGATIELSRDLVTAYKLGNENPQEIKAGKISVRGSIEDLYTNRDLMGKLMGVKDFYGTLEDFTFYMYPNGVTTGQPRIGVSNVKLSGGTISVDGDSLIANDVTFEGIAVTIDTVPA